MGGGGGGLLYSLRQGSAGVPPVPRFNLSNARGDVVAQTDTSGTITWSANYEAYGKRPVEEGTNADRQRANTKEEDPTGLLNEGFRYRDLETGTWLSRDPAGFVDGPNLYAYVRQNPWSKFDPLGLYEYENPDAPHTSMRWNADSTGYVHVIHGATTPNQGVALCLDGPRYVPTAGTETMSKALEVVVNKDNPASGKGG